MSATIKSLAAKFQAGENEAAMVAVSLGLGGAPELTDYAAEVFRRYADEYCASWPGAFCHDRKAVAKREAAQREAAQRDMVRVQGEMRAAAVAEETTYLGLAAASQSGDRARYDAALRAHGEAQDRHRKLVAPGAGRVLPHFGVNRDVL